MSCSDSSLPLSNCNPCLNCPPTPAILAPCPDGEPCDELALLSCVKYSGDEIVDANIKAGDRLDEIMQKMLIGIINADASCISPTVKSAVKLRSTAIAKDSITIAWTSPLDATAINLQYKAASAQSFTPVVATGLNTKQITGLLAGTKYYFKISSLSNGNITCNSVTIAVTTKAA
jgi:hypothetical protein